MNQFLNKEKITPAAEEPINRLFFFMKEKQMKNILLTFTSIFCSTANVYIAIKYIALINITVYQAYAVGILISTVTLYNMVYINNPSDTYSRFMDKECQEKRLNLSVLLNVSILISSIIAAVICKILRGY